MLVLRKIATARSSCCSQLRLAGSNFSEQQRWFKPNGLDTGIRIYNAPARRAVPLLLPNDNYATWYTCGPTVYDAAHLGHASCYVKLDIIQRILRSHFQINLVTAMNVTDIDDKLILKSAQTGQEVQLLAQQYEMEFWSDLRKLNVQQPNIKMRVTAHMPEIVQFIEQLMAQGYAYVGKDNSVYFDVSKYPLYGKMQRLQLNDETAETTTTQAKASQQDFALWKARKHANEPSWPSPWGAGRPGWHIECSSLASSIFGQQLDFHAGGIDLRFPHHENEDAQSCCYHNTPQWVNYWLHTGHLHVKGQTQKMSKSLKNTISIDDMLHQYTADEFRMACVMSNYRHAMEYADELMQTARNTLNKFKSFQADCNAYLCGKKLGSSALLASNVLLQLMHVKEQVHLCLRDDFDTAGVIRVMLDQISSISRCINAVEPTTTTASRSLDAVAAVDNFVQETLRCFGFAFVAHEHGMLESSSLQQSVNLNALLEDILLSRKAIKDRAVLAKDAKLFQVCDELRNCLRSHGIEVRDHSQGSSWSFVQNAAIKSQ